MIKKKKNNLTHICLFFSNFTSPLVTFSPVSTIHTVDSQIYDFPPHNIQGSPELHVQIPLILPFENLIHLNVNMDTK